MNRYVYLAVPVLVGIVSGYVMAAGAGQYGAQPAVAGLAEDGSPVLGEQSAPVTILEWGDYQCTFCFRFHESSLQAIKAEYIDTGRAKLVFKDFPLNGPDSVLAAEASYCAEDQGRYWEYHGELYSNWAGERTGWITRESLGAFAESAGLRADEFESCMDAGKHRQRVLELEQYGRRIGVDATPSFFVFNDREVIKIRGNQPLEVFRQAIGELGG